MKPDLVTADDLSTELCTLGGAEHDYRPYKYLFYNRDRTSMRCVHCHVVRCGDYGEDEPCIEPYHHPVPHRTADGTTWPLGGDRP